MARINLSRPPHGTSVEHEGRCVSAGNVANALPWHSTAYSKGCCCPAQSAGPELGEDVGSRRAAGEMPSQGRDRAPGTALCLSICRALETAFGFVRG